MTKVKTTDTSAKPKASFVPKVLKVITLPILKKVDGVAVYVKILGEIFTGKEMKGKDSGDMAAAELVNVIDLETGEPMQMICNAVLKSTLEENYPDGGYVGLGFSIEQMKVEGKRYKNYRINQIEVPA